MAEISKNDQELIDSFLENRPPGITQIPKLVDEAVCYHSLWYEIDIEGLKQDSLGDLTTNLRNGGYRGDGTLEAYVKGIYRMKEKNAYRRWRIRKKYKGELPDGIEPEGNGKDPLEQLIASEDVALCVQAIRNLNVKDQTYLVLRFEHGLSHEEVGARLGISKGASRKRLLDCRDRLRKELDNLKKGPNDQ